jgi:hypothetical protein
LYDIYEICVLCVESGYECEYVEKEENKRKRKGKKRRREDDGGGRRRTERRTPTLVPNLVILY